MFKSFLKQQLQDIMDEGITEILTPYETNTKLIQECDDMDKLEFIYNHSKNEKVKKLAVKRGKEIVHKTVKSLYSEV